MSDLYSRYEIGLRRLLEQMGQDHPLHSEALVYQQRLDENVAQSRRYGDTDTRKAERSEIIDRLNELALSALDTAFSELCSLSTLRMRKQPAEHLQPGDNSGKTRIEIVLKGDLSKFTPEVQSIVLRVLSSILDIPYDQMWVLEVRGGSIILQIEIPAQAAKRLADLCEAGAPVILGLGIQQISIAGIQRSPIIVPTSVPRPSEGLLKDPRYSNILQELEDLEGGKSSTDPNTFQRIIDEMTRLLGGTGPSPNKGEIGMQHFAMAILTRALDFLFDEARKILAERRQRRQEMEEADDTVALPDGVEESSKETILELKPANLDQETQEEVDHLLELIKIQRGHRRKAEVKINKLGGILFVPPNVRVELENAEDEILKHTQRLKKLLEKVYNQPIYIDGLE
jgi:hypothetical protein